jgi:hypothetical protein
MQMDKFQLCVQMTQCGKTFIAIDTMIKRLQINPNEVHVVYTMNTLLNNHQFAKRLEKIETTYGKGSILVFASKFTGMYLHAKDYESLKSMVSVSMPRVIIMCSNHIRFEQGQEWVNEMNESNPDVSLHMYYDELHKYMTKKIRTMLEKIHALTNVKSIMGLTATPDSIIQKRGIWSKVNVMKINTSLEGYTRLSDMEIVRVNDYFPLDYIKPWFNDFETMDNETIGFMKHVFDSNPDMFQESVRCFVPAHIRRVGHIRVRDLIWERCPQAIIIIINGEDKNVQYQEAGVTKKVSLVSNMEVSDNIASIIKSNGWEKRPMFVTGFLCVGMGQTLTNKSYGNFTHSILSHLSINNDSIYQLYGRLTGRMKEWETYQPTKLYCPTTIYNRIKVMEECALQSMKKLELTRESYHLPINVMPEGIDVRDNQKMDAF